MQYAFLKLKSTKDTNFPDCLVSCYLGYEFDSSPRVVVVRAPCTLTVKAIFQLRFRSHAIGTDAGVRYCAAYFTTAKLERIPRISYVQFFLRTQKHTLTHAHFITRKSTKKTLTPASLAMATESKLPAFDHRIGWNRGEKALCIHCQEE